MSEWTETILADACERIDYGYTASATDAPTGPRFLRITDIVSGHLDWDAVPYCEIDESDIPKYRLEDGDIVVARTGASTGCSMHIASPPEAVFASYLVRLRVKDGLDARFVSYCLKTREFKHFITAASSGKSAQPNASAKTITQAVIGVPPLLHQQRIAHILGTLDDKIELNRRMNRTLEAIARAIFRSWFIDFDPVHAKAEGREPIGMDPETAALFPGSFQDSPLGRIPDGWNVGCLGDVASRRQQTIKPEEMEDGTPYVALDDVPRRSISLHHWKAAEDIASAKSRFQKGDVLFGKLRPYFHKVVVAPVDGICSTDIIVVSAKDEELSAFVLMTCSSADFVAHNTAVMTGTKMPRTNWKDMSSYKLVIPTDEVVAAYKAATKALINQLVGCIKQSPCLAGVRDMLLPRLIAGEV